MGPSLTGNGSRESMSNIKDTVNKNRFTKEDICYSTITPLQKQRRDHIDEIEYGLLQHPLALYPHLEDGVPPDVSAILFTSIYKFTREFIVVIPAKTSFLVEKVL